MGVAIDADEAPAAVEVSDEPRGGAYIGVLRTRPIPIAGQAGWPGCIPISKIRACIY